MMEDFNYLSTDEKKAITQVIHGVDVTSLSLATTLRNIEKKQTEHDHDLIMICSAQGDYDAYESQPYFGCIALVDGLKAVEKLA